MEDYIIREIDKIGDVLALIASKLGLGTYAFPTDQLAVQMNTELVNDLDVDIYELLSKDNPLEYLVSEKGFSDRNLESLAVMMYQAGPTSDTLETFIKSTAAYLNQKGVFSFALHSVIN